MDIKLAYKVDANNPIVDDLFLDDNGQLAWTIGAEAIAQHIRIRLRFFKGEWFLDPDEGIPYFQEVFKKQTGRDRVEKILRKAITDTPGVAKLLKFSATYEASNRSLHVIFDALLDTGKVLKSTDFGLFILRV